MRVRGVLAWPFRMLVNAFRAMTLERPRPRERAPRSAEPDARFGRGSRDGEWRDIRAMVVARDGGKCVDCTREDDLQVHHVRPLAKGGSNSPRNLVTLCGACHKRRHRGGAKAPAGDG